jgi:hypothetical protein
MPAGRRALLALDVETGETVGASRALAARLVGVSPTSVAAAAQLDAETRERLRANPRLRVALRAQRPPSDADVDALIRRIGIERALKSFDRLTAPTPLAAE